ncbi:hypothetical protein NDU88_001366 [Pleurodeles waltl]|uniref:Uncharacterized protein n=1 Tax=Pleurodeles waltl TaxID=8319 RepID=A0AAV7UVV2_PLEWA|nr:hypothetical protein NDU88_001366 [Pleurodeles waltl]
MVKRSPMGALAEDTHARYKTRTMKGGAEQALLPFETSKERGETSLEESHLGAAFRRAAPMVQHQDILLVVSDEEEEVQAAAGGSDSGVEMVNMLMIVQEGRMLQFIPRLVIRMLHKPGVDFVENYAFEEEVLDYEEGDEPEEGEIVQQTEEKKGYGKKTTSNGGRSFGVFQEPTEKAVQSDRQDGTGKWIITAVNLPRGVGLLKAMKMALLRFKQMWAETHIVWIELVPRLYFQVSVARSDAVFEEMLRSRTQVSSGKLYLVANGKSRFFTPVPVSRFFKSVFGLDNLKMGFISEFFQVVMKCVY